MDLQALHETFRIPDYANLTCDSLGLDSLDQCLDLDHFESYDPISYHFNSLGYRTDRPESFSGREILAIGDSFTLGLGLDAAYTWPAVLSKLLARPVLNFSLNGASNRWMVRRLQDLLRFFDPPLVVVHYSFSHRRELDRTDWFDNERTLSEPSQGLDIDYQDWIDCSRQIRDLCRPIGLIESFIPGWHPAAVTYDRSLIPPIYPVDRARDSFHYGPRSHAIIAGAVYAKTTTLPVAL